MRCVVGRSLHTVQAALQLLVDPGKDAQVIASGYAMDLYCEVAGSKHGYREGQAQFNGETWADCAKQARRAGWKINKRRRECICPKCVRMGLKLSKVLDGINNEQ